MRRGTVDQESGTRGGCKDEKSSNRQDIGGLSAGNADQQQDRVVQAHNGKTTASEDNKEASKGRWGGGGVGGGTRGVG